MINVVYSLPSNSGRIIPTYTTSLGSNFLFFAELTSNEPLKCTLKFKNQQKNEKCRELSYRIKIPSHGDRVLSQLQLIEVPSIIHNRVSRDPVLVINTGDGIQIVQVEDLFLAGNPDRNQKDENLQDKWTLRSRKDCITSFHASPMNDGSIVVTYSTKSGEVTTFTYKRKLGKFYLTENRRDFADDTLNNVTSGRRVLSKWEEQVGLPDELSFSCFDDCIYSLSINGGKLEKQSVLGMTGAEPCILTCVDFVVAKKYTTTSLKFYCCNISNMGCVLYKRSTRGDWDLCYTFKREITNKEITPLVNCQIVCEENSILTIFSGSENGNLYIWRYHYLDELLLDSQTYQVGSPQDVVHDLQVTKSRVYFIRNREEVAYINY